MRASGSRSRPAKKDLFVGRFLEHIPLVVEDARGGPSRAGAESLVEFRYDAGNRKTFIDCSQYCVNSEPYRRDGQESGGLRPPYAFSNVSSSHAAAAR